MGEVKLNRRSFIKTSARLGVGVGVLNFAGCGTLDRIFGPDPGQYDEEVLIVGGGLAGLTAAYELKKRNVAFRVLEASSRPGGRVYTISHFNDSKQWAELGGDFIDPRHFDLLNLCSELKLPLFGVGGSSSKGIPSSFLWKGQLIGGRQMEKELSPYFREIFRIRSQVAEGDFKDQFPFGVRATEEVKNLDKVPLSEFLESLKVPRNERALQYLSEAAHLQFGRETENLSSLQFLASLDPEPRKQRVQRIEGGAETLTRTLYERTKGVLPEFFIRFNTGLQSIENIGSRFVCRIQTPRGSQIISAKYIIMAIPPTALRRVEGIDALEMSDEKKAAIRGIKLATHSRVVLGFSEQFWDMKSIGPQWRGNLLGLPKTQSCYEASMGMDGTGGILSFTMGGQKGIEAGASRRAEALQDLQLLWKRAPSFWSQKVAIKNWSRHRGIEGSMVYYGPGEMTKWNGVFSSTDYDDRLVFAGEHASERFYGSMQGAVETGKAAAEKIALAIKKSQGVS